MNNTLHFVDLEPTGSPPPHSSTPARQSTSGASDVAFPVNRSPAKEMRLAPQIWRIDWIETGGRIRALLKEAALIKQLPRSPGHPGRRATVNAAVSVLPGRWIAGLAR